MKKTFILISALAGTIACEGATLWTTTVTATAGGAITTTRFSPVAGDVDVPLSTTIDSLKTQKGGTNIGFLANTGTRFVPNTNVQSADGWVAEFTCTGLAADIGSIDSMSFDIYSRAGGGGQQNNNRSVRPMLQIWDGTAWSEVIYITEGNAAHDIVVKNGSDINNAVTITFDLSSITVPTDELKFRLTMGTPAQVDGSFFGLARFTVNGELMIPEPATASLGILGLAGLLLRRRRVA